jgi:hypothetical protein
MGLTLSKVLDILMVCSVTMLCSELYFLLYTDLANCLFTPFDFNFAANYIIAVAVVNDLTSFSAPKLDDYAQPITVYPAGR